MDVVALVALVWVLLSLERIAHHLRRLADHHARFHPPDDAP
jgi:hypothetical protein